jgi:hypothetical protein
MTNKQSVRGVESQPLPRFSANWRCLLSAQTRLACLVTFLSVVEAIAPQLATAQSITPAVDGDKHNRYSKW